MSNKNIKIQVKSQDKCFLCGTNGVVRFTNLVDSLFNTQGEWSLMECRNSNCSLVWLNPMPLEHEIWKAYENYYTHVKLDHNNKKLSLGVVVGNMLEILFIPPFLRREKERVWTMGLKENAVGKLLEIGCGDGARLEYFNKLGWIVEGQEIDLNAKAVVDNKFKVHIGDLCKLSLIPSSYDAIISNHVIEHIYNPIEFLDECYKLLKPGGVLVAVTPNFKSFGCQIFKSNWRGLEPPRHIYVYSPNSLKILIEKSLFKKGVVSTTTVNAVVNASSSLKKDKSTNKLNRAVILVEAYLFQFIESMYVCLNKRIGEECILTAYKCSSIENELL